MSLHGFHLPGNLRNVIIFSLYITPVSTMLMIPNKLLPARHPNAVLSTSVPLCEFDLPAFARRDALDAKEKELGSQARLSKDSLRELEELRNEAEAARVMEKEEACRLEAEKAVLRTRYEASCFFFFFSSSQG